MTAENFQRTMLWLSIGGFTILLITGIFICHWIIYGRRNNEMKETPNRKIKNREKNLVDENLDIDELLVTKGSNFANGINNNSVILLEGINRKQHGLIKERVNVIEEQKNLSSREMNLKRRKEVDFQEKILPRKKSDFEKNILTFSFFAFISYLFLLTIFVATKNSNINLTETIPLIKSFSWIGLTVFIAITVKSFIQIYLKRKQETEIIKNIKGW